MKSIEHLPNTSKIWIYQSSKSFSETDIKVIEDETTAFLIDWQSHGQKMDAAFQAFFNQFLIIALDETSANASGCGIDKQVNFVKKLQQTLGIDFFDRLNLCFSNNGIKNIYTEIPKLFFTHYSKINLFESNEYPYLFDNTITTKFELENDWIKPISKTWLAKHLVC